MLKLERWIVYPLLMLSLFSSLLIQVIRFRDTRSGRSKKLVVVNEQEMKFLV